MGKRAVEVTDFDRRLAEEIRVELARINKSRRWLSRQSGLTVNYLDERVRGERPFTAGDVAAIAKVLHTPPDQLIRRADRTA